MSIAADALQPFTVRGLTDVHGRPSGLTLADLINGQARAGYDLEFDSPSQSFSLDFRDASAIAHALASESARFASAAFQSMAKVTINLINDGMIPWGLIHAYYAAFYAGNAIIRLTGQSCSYLTRDDIAQVAKLASAIGKEPGFRLEKGLYLIVIDTHATRMQCRSMRAAAGGTHESFWDSFGKRLDTLSSEVLHGTLTPREAQLVFTKLGELHSTIRRGGAPLHSWLSIIRNDIQYKHRHGAWLPCQIKKSNREQLGRIACQWERDPMMIDIKLTHGGQLGEFVAACAFIVALCRVVLERLAGRSSISRRSFASLGPLSVLRRCVVGKTS